MTGRLPAAAVLACLAIAPPGTAAGGEIDGSPLALASVRLEDASPARPVATRTERLPEGAPLARDAAGRRFALEEGPLLAQRVITREWGASDDSVYVEFDVPGYKSEGWAMALSGAVPGAGHFYLGETSAWLFVLAEAAAWTSRWVFRDRAGDLKDESIRYAGSPYDSTSNWSFVRYFQATQGDTLALQQLFAGDRDAFYRLIGFDQRYQEGWKDDSFTVRDGYQILENKSQRHLKRARYATGAIVLTHVVAALDALQAARRNNLPLQRNFRLRLEGSLGAEGEAMSVALERRF